MPAKTMTAENAPGKENVSETTQTASNWTSYRIQQHRRVVFILSIFVTLGWVLGKLDFGIYWLLGLVVSSVVWWRRKNASLQELVFKEAELQGHRSRAFQSEETVEWLNFLINRWMVFSDRSLLHIIKSNLDPLLEASKPNFVGSIEVRDFTLGVRTPFIKYASVYDGLDDLKKLRATELNVNNPPEDLMTRSRYQAIVQLDMGLVSPESLFVIRARLGNKGLLGADSDIAVEDFQISGKAEIVLIFNKNIPFPHLAAITFCFIQEPEVSFNIRLLKAVQVMEFPLIRQWISQMVNDCLKLALVDPGRIMIPLCDNPDLQSRGAAYACGVLTLTIDGGTMGKLTDDPYWCSIKLRGQKRLTREVIGDIAWRDYVSVLVYSLHSDKLTIKLKGRRKFGNKYTITEYVLPLARLSLDSNPQQEFTFEKSNLKSGTLITHMEYTPLPVIEVNNSVDREEFNRKYRSTLSACPDTVSGVLLVCVHNGQNLIPMDKNGLSQPSCAIYENMNLVKKGETAKDTLDPEWDTMVEFLVADYTQTTLSYVVLDRSAQLVKVKQDDKDSFMGSCILQLNQDCPVMFKKNLDLHYKVRQSGMMKAGRLCVSVIFRPVLSVAKSETRQRRRGLSIGELPGQKEVKTDAQALEALLKAARGSIELTVYKGRDLVAKDVNGKSDPFVIIKVGRDGREKFKSRVQFKTLNPVWSEKASVAMPDKAQMMFVEVWDKDPLSQERMGQVVFTAEELMELSKQPSAKRWFKLQQVKSGEIQLGFQHIPPQRAVADETNNNENNSDATLKGKQDSRMVRFSVSGDEDDSEPDAVTEEQVPLLTRTWSQGSAGSSSSSSTTVPSPRISGKILGDLRGKWRTRRQEWLQSSPRSPAKSPRKRIPTEEARLPKPLSSPSPRNPPIISDRDTPISENRATAGKLKAGKLRAVVDSVRLLSCSSATANFPSSDFRPYGVSQDRDGPVDLERGKSSANSGKKGDTRTSPEMSKYRTAKKRLGMWRGPRQRRSNSESQLSELMSHEHFMQSHELVPLDNIKISSDNGQCTHSVFMAKSHGKPLTLVVMDTSREANQNAQSEPRDSDTRSRDVDKE